MWHLTRHDARVLLVHVLPTRAPHVTQEHMRALWDEMGEGLVEVLRQPRAERVLARRLQVGGFGGVGGVMMCVCVFTCACA